MTTIFKALLPYPVLSVWAFLAVCCEASATDVMLPAALDNTAQLRHSSSIHIKQFGTEGEEQAYKSVFDDEGNLYVTGYTTGDLDGAGPEVNAGAYDIYVTKLNRLGQIVWIRQFGSPEEDRAHSIVLDHRGYVYVTGHTDGDFDGNGPEIHRGSGDAILLKLDENGEMQWLRQFGTDADDMGLNLTIDRVGNSYVTGFTEGDIDGDGPDESAGYYDIFLAMYDMAGSLHWTRQIGSPDDDVAYAVTLDAHGSIYATGYSYGDLDDSGSGVNAGEADIVVLKFDEEGKPRWIQQIGTAGDDYGYAITVDHHYRLYITGYVSGDLDRDGPDIHAGRTDLAVIKMSRRGDLLWSRQFGAAGNDLGHGIAISHSGAVYVTGGITGDLDGPGPQIHQGRLDVAMIKLSRHGALQSARQWGTPANDLGLDIILDRKHRAYITGQTQGDLDGAGPQTHAGDFDSFILKFGPPEKSCAGKKAKKCHFKESKEAEDDEAGEDDEDD